MTAARAELAGPLPDWLVPARPGLTRFGDLLADVGVTRGLIGPREVPRLWSRHLLNCAVVADPAAGLVPSGARVADVGSGAGLPGVVWALCRPDLSVVLIEPLLRRATFLTEAITALDLTDRVAVLRSRAEDAGRTDAWRPADVVTARAVAPLERLLGWTMPLVAEGGRMLALKGSTAADEVAATADVARMQRITLAVVECGNGVVEPATTVIVARRDRAQ